MSFPPRNISRCMAISEPNTGATPENHIATLAQCKAGANCVLRSLVKSWLVSRLLPARGELPDATRKCLPLGRKTPTAAWIAGKKLVRTAGVEPARELPPSGF